MSELLPNEHTDAEIAAGIRDATVDRSDMAGFWGWRAADAIERPSRARDEARAALETDPMPTDVAELQDTVARLLRELDEATEGAKRAVQERDEARAAAEYAATVFERYAALHKTKLSIDGDRKAQENLQHAQRCRRALAPREGGGDA